MPACSPGHNVYERMLKLSGCAAGEFTCNDGQCVTMEERCNQLPDCKDKSDEQKCRLLVLEESYNKEVAPITKTVTKVNVTISIDLMKIVNI